MPVLHPPVENSATGHIDHRESDGAVKSFQAPALKCHIETYGCQMNFSDSEIVASILEKEGYSFTADQGEADLVLLNTCSIRDNAEQKVRARLNEIRRLKSRRPGMLVGVLGCMAERLKHKLLEEEQIVDLVAGPDAYRDIASLVRRAGEGQKAVNVLLSREETYGDISPVRLSGNGVTAFISIMRGCNNMCSFCVVPFTRGRERSRSLHSIVSEALALYENGYREVTLLGQNVDSYNWEDMSKGTTYNFAGLLDAAARNLPKMRIRFSTSHPKDMTDEVLHVMARHDNICKSIHLPVQSGSSRILKLMNRTYDREWYLGRIAAVRSILPGCGLSTDIIAGFCTETEEDHEATLSLMEAVRYDLAYMFKYSERPGTLAARHHKDDVPEETKTRRLNEIIALQQKHSLENNRADLNKVHQVLAEGTSKRSDKDLYGRNSRNKVVVFPAEGHRPGDLVKVFVERCTSATLGGRATKIVGS